MNQIGATFGQWMGQYNRLSTTEKHIILRTYFSMINYTNIDYNPVFLYRK